jgi:Fe-S cluster assembly ATPase SufC
MRDTRLVFVEGIMGSGKSTTARFLTEHLQYNQIAARFVLEGPTVEEPDHPLRVATDFPHPNRIWLDVTIEHYIERSLLKWHNFVQEARRSPVTTICDGLLFHGNMTDLMLMNAKPHVLHRYVGQVIECIQYLHPVLIYFY